jgi:hypothetical protein
MEVELNLSHQNLLSLLGKNHSQMERNRDIIEDTTIVLNLSNRETIQVSFHLTINNMCTINKDNLNILVG